jgi:hypothetical protein
MSNSSVGPELELAAEGEAAARRARPLLGGRCDGDGGAAASRRSGTAGGGLAGGRKEEAVEDVNAGSGGRIARAMATRVRARSRHNARELSMRESGAPRAARALRRLVMNERVGTQRRVGGSGGRVAAVDALFAKAAPKAGGANPNPCTYLIILTSF